jgi:diguanylate cyclase (GGDEF)-like protein
MSGLWSTTQTAIFLLLALAGVFVVTVHDVLPGTILGSARYVVEGSAAITFATLLLVLTGGSASPFFFAYALIVSGAALILKPRLSVLVTAFAIGGYLVGIFADSSRLPLSAAGQVTVGVNVAALILLSYVGTVVAREQRRSRDMAIELSTVDSLTGLYNRAYLFAAVDREIQRSARSRRGFCLLMMDLDELKPINDRFGHFHGDRVLRGVAEIISHGVRRLDTAARYGGDEFVVLLPETEPHGAYVLAEKIRQGVSELAIETPRDRIRTSLSIGIVTYPEDGRTADQLMISADQAMYSSKRRGKNRIVGYVRYVGAPTMLSGVPTRPVSAASSELTGAANGGTRGPSRSGVRPV